MLIRFDEGDAVKKILRNAVMTFSVAQRLFLTVVLYTLDRRVFCRSVWLEEFKLSLNLTYSFSLWSAHQIISLNTHGQKINTTVR